MLVFVLAKILLPCTYRGEIPFYCKIPSFAGYRGRVGSIWESVMLVMFLYKRLSSANKQTLVLGERSLRMSYPRKILFPRNPSVSLSQVDNYRKASLLILLIDTFKIDKNT